MCTHMCTHTHTHTHTRARTHTHGGSNRERCTSAAWQWARVHDHTPRPSPRALSRPSRTPQHAQRRHPLPRAPPHPSISPAAEPMQAEEQLVQRDATKHNSRHHARTPTTMDTAQASQTRSSRPKPSSSSACRTTVDSLPSRRSARPCGHAPRHTTPWRAQLHPTTAATVHGCYCRSTPILFRSLASSYC